MCQGVDVRYLIVVGRGDWAGWGGGWGVGERALPWRNYGDGELLQSKERDGGEERNLWSFIHSRGCCNFAKGTLGVGLKVVVVVERLEPEGRREKSDKEEKREESSQLQKRVGRYLMEQQVDSPYPWGGGDQSLCRSLFRPHGAP